MVQCSRQNGVILEQFNVPDLERLTGDGWISPFCKAYGLKEHRRHGEAGSVDLQAVEEERKKLGMTLATYPLKDRLRGCRFLA